jgi:D-arabinose 1-dehydrogenase-like Zn-dependent alcohol dehydrogenase
LFLSGGLPETQEMLDYCAEHNIVSDIEMIDIKTFMMPISEWKSIAVSICY